MQNRRDFIKHASAFSALMAAAPAVVEPLSAGRPALTAPASRPASSSATTTIRRLAQVTPRQ